MTTRSVINWTPEVIAEMRRLRATDGYSMTMTADALTVKFGQAFTKNAVIGKLARLGDEHRPPQRVRTYSGETKPRVRPLSVAKVRVIEVDNPKLKFPATVAAAPIAVVPVKPVEPTTSRFAYQEQDDGLGRPVTAISLDDLGIDECKQIYGDVQVPGWTYCGRPKCGKSVYCEGHHRLNYVPSSERSAAIGALHRVATFAGRPR